MGSIGIGMTSPSSSESHERLLGSFATSFSHGLLIIRDRRSVSTHDHWDPSTSGIDVQRDSIYLAVLNAVDGVVEVKFSEGGGPDAGLTYVYQGSLEIPSGQVVAHDPNEDLMAVFYVEPGLNRFSVAVDKDGDASVVSVRVNPTVES